MYMTHCKEQGASCTILFEHIPHQGLDPLLLLALG